MTRIKNTNVYSIDETPSLEDMVIGSDADMSGKTKNYKIGAIVNLIAELTGESLGNNYMYSTGSVEYSEPGYFFSGNNSTNASQITKLLFNKVNSAGVNLTPLFEALAGSILFLKLKITKPGDPNSFAFFSVTGLAIEETHFVLTVELFQNSFSGSLQSDSMYSISLDASGGQPEDDGENNNSDAVEQVVGSGGNYNDLEVTGDILIFANENAQAILNGVWGKKEFLIRNLSDYELRINSLDTNAANGRKIKLPTGLASIGIQGTTRLIFSESMNHYVVVDVWNSKYDPAFPEITEESVLTIGTDAMRKANSVRELMTYNDIRSTEYTKADLNTDFPTKKKGEMVFLTQLNKLYLKKDNNTNDWIGIDGSLVL